MPKFREADTLLGPYRERDSVFLTANVRDETGTAIPGVNLTSLTWTLYNEKDLAVINSRNDVNGVPNVDGSGVFSLTLTPDDMPIIGTGVTEYHRLLIEWMWDTTKRGSHEIRIEMSNVEKVP